MRKLYTIKANIQGQTSKLMLITVLLIFSAFNSYSQEIVPFAPRASSANPSTTVYTVKGDFVMIGNTNLTLANYGVNTNNNNDMIYVDVDNDIDTWNSSSAYLDFSQENGAVPSCSNIIYAGLYWTGRAGSSETFSVTKDGDTKQFNKREVLFRKGTTGAYETVIANSTSLVNKNIYFPSGTEGDMYSAYAEVTDYVKVNGIGEYFVADIATIEGNGGNTGYYGGWGMVVVYENSQMNWRDVTVFDGHAYVQGSTTIDYTFDVNGFNTAQSGDINLKLGVMAGEGDVGVTGDYFEIQRQDNNQFERLSHSTNSTTNFFNSSINTGGNARNPNLVNNTGVDISMFSIDNTGNGVITNNQNQTTFRYGSTQDTYVIFNVTFSVDSYVPEVTGVITNTSINGIPNPAPVIIEPGQSAQYKLEIKNAGTEATNNTLVTIPIPDTVDPTNLNFTFNTNYTPDDSTDPVYNPSIGSNGAILWNLGTLPLPSDPETVLADISFDLTATTDCASLGDIINTPPSITLFGTISGSGAISNVTFNTPLIQGYSASDICKESPIPIPIIIPIDVTNFSTDPPTIAVPAVLTIEGCDENNITDTTARYIYSATQSADIKNNFVDVSAGYTVSNDIASITYVDVISSTSNCAVVVTRTYTATNNCGSTADAVQTITVEDTTAPVVTVPAADLSMECFDATAVATWAATASANDNCDGTLTVTPTYTAPADNCNQTVTVTFTATDACGNIGTATKDFIVDDNTAPVLTVPAADLTMECFDVAAVATWAATASANDNCDGSLSVTPTYIAPADNCNQTVTVTFTATDACGNIGTATKDFTVDDNTAPSITGGSALAVECDGTGNLTEYQAWLDGNAGATATDNCGVVIWSNTIVDQFNSCGATGDTEVRFTAEDECGNQSTFSAVFKIEDTTAPTIIAPSDITIQCDQDPDDINNITGTPTGISDTCSTTNVGYNDVITAGNCANNFIITRTWTATDECGNSSSDVQSITVEDTTAPVITVPAADLSMECFDATAVATWAATASANDNCDGTLTVTPTYTAPADNCNQIVTVTFTATDACGNINTATKDFIVNDNTAPTITCPANITVTADLGQPNANITIALPSVSDNCDANVAYTNDYTGVEDASGIYNLGTTTVTYTATDNCGNTTQCSFTVTVNDNEAPEINCPPTITVSCIDLVPAAYSNYAEFLAAGGSATDNNGIDQATFALVSESSDNNSCPETISRVYTISDTNGNSSECTQFIIVNDEIDPVAPSAPADIAYECAADVPAAGDLTATDNCAGDITVTGVDSTDNTDPCNVIITRTWTFTDSCSNSSSVSQTITVTDTTAPVAPSAPADIAYECAADVPAAGDLTATDNCAGDITVTGVDSTDNTDPCNVIITRTWTFTDSCSNSSSVSQTITVTPTTPPVVPANTGSTVECIADATQPVAPVVTDVCGNDITPVITENEDPVCEGEKIYTFTYTDCAGNNSVYTYTYTIDVTTAPVVPANAASTVECIADATQPAAPVVTDVCGNDITPVITENADPVCEGEKIYTFTYTDCAGNSSVYTYTYAIDLTAFIMPANGLETVDNLADAVEPTPPTVTDNCGNPITPVLSDVSNTPDCQGSIVYTFTYEDCAGNSADWTYTYTVILAPFTLPADEASTVECIADAIAPTPPTVFDANGNEVVPVMTQNDDPVCEGEKIYTFTYTDCAGNTADWIYTYTIDVTTAPVVPANAGSTVECIADATQPVAPVVTDVCGNDITPVITENEDPVCEGEKIYTFTYTDCAGNNSVYAYTYTIDVTTAPVVPANAGSTVECIADATQPVAPVVTDVCGNDITPVITENEDPVCEGEKIYTFTYTDCAGNSSVYTYTYTIDVTTAPVVPANAASTVECIADATQPATPVVTDVCGNEITPVITENEDPVCEGDKIYTFTYTDCAGNSSVYTYTYTIDLTDFILPVNGLETVDNLADAVEPTPPTVTDNCGNPITPVLSDVSITPDCQGTIEYTFTYTDCASNTADWKYTYTIILAPFTLPADEASTVECIADAIAPTPPTVFDANGNEVVPVLTENDDPVCEGEKIYTFTYTDCADNTADWIYTYTVRDDIAPIAPDAPANMTFECIDDVPVANNLTAVDNCSGDITVSGIDSVDNSNPCNVIITRTWTFTDDCGNSSSVAHIITVTDTTAPVAPSAPANATFECIEDVPVAGNLTASDNCVGDITVGGNDSIDTTNPCNIIITRTWTFTDDCGNSSAVSQTITIIDTTAPVLVSDLDTEISVSCAEVPDVPNLEFEDNCDSNVNIDFSETNTFDETILMDYEIVRTWTVSDACGNANIYTQTLQVSLDEVVTEIIGEDRCFDDGVIDLNDYLQVPNLTGVWEMIEGDTDAILEDNIFDPTVLELSLDFKPGTGGIDYLFKYTTTDSGCISITYVSMNINADCIVLPCGSEDVVISKAITPNGDQYNEYFEIGGVELCGFITEVKIFNRWGALVYESKNYQNNWNGTTTNSGLGNAGTLPNGTYYYIVVLNSSGLNPFTGPVYIGTK